MTSPRGRHNVETLPPRRESQATAIILAAGYGRRMRPLTDHAHKTLLKVGDKTILGRIIDSLLANDVHDIVIVTGYRSRDIERFLRATYPGKTFQLVENTRYRETNNIYSMALALEHVPIDRDVLLVESDLVVAPEVIARVLDSPHPNVALVDRYRSGMDGTVVVLHDGLITDVVPPHRQHVGFSFDDKYKTLNIYKFSREFCASSFRRLLTYYARTIDGDCYYELILGVLIYMRQVSIAAEILDGEPWAEADDPNDLAVARFLLDPPSRRGILESAKGGFWAHDVLDFHFLRNMHFPTAAMFAELRSALPALLQNYGSSQSALDEKLSYFLLCKKERVAALSGASQVFPYLRRRFEGASALVPDPTFGEWPRAFPRAARYADRIGIDAQRLEAQARDVDVVVFVNPNNPTGTLLESDWIYEFARANPKKTILVDESFQGFTQRASIASRLEKDPLPNVVVVVSLSKTLGVPGARMGYLYTCDVALLAELRAEIPIWNLGSVAEHLLEVVLKHRESLAESYARTAADRDALAQALASIPGVRRVYPSGGNFLLVSLDAAAWTQDSTALVDRLLEEHRIYIKDVTSRFEGGAPWLRLAVRLPHENAALVSALATLLRAPGR